MQTIIAILVSIPIGIACSVAAWWILFRKIVPEISFSDGISKTKVDDHETGFCYRIKFENVGRRDIIDIQIHAYLRIIGLRSGKASGIITNVRLVTSKEYVPKMKADGKGFIVTVYPERTKNFQRKVYPENVQRKVAEESLLLEDVLSLGYDSKLRIVVFAYDNFSGARRIFESKLYGLSDIKEGNFKGWDNFDVMRNRTKHSSRKLMATELQGEDSSVQHFLPIAGVALAGIIQVSSQDGPFNLWNVMIGVPLMLLLAAYEPRVAMKRTERLAWSVTWGLTATSTLGVLFQALYRICAKLPGRLPPFHGIYGEELKSWEAPYWYYFAVWLVLSTLAYLYFRRHAWPRSPHATCPND